MHRAVPLMAAMLMIAGACSGGGDAATSTEPPSTTTTAAATTAADGPSTTTTVAGSTTTTASEPSTTTTEPEPLFLAGLEPIDVTTPASGGGIRPELAWDPIDAAAYYVVYVYAPDGTAYWSWQGSETSVPVGGRPALSDGAPGPAVVDGMTWAVIGYDADELPVGSSVLAPIGP